MILPFLVFAPLLPTMQTDIPKHVATTPVSRMKEAWWAERHRFAVELTRDFKPEIAFLGDSITQAWQTTGAPLWNSRFAAIGAGNFGFSGDRTEHVLWRLENGEILGAQPKVIVLMIGTNNIGHGSSNAQQTADGVTAIVRKLRKDTPRSKILLLGIFPRGEAPNDPMRLAVDEATKLFAPLHDGRHVFFEDIGRHFLHKDGTLRSRLMPDRLHLDPMGYEVWARALELSLLRLLS